MRAFSDEKYDYYELMKPLGLDRNSGKYILPKGSIFVYDKDDNKLGSIAEGCLKLCWTPDGNCYGTICGETVIFHASFKDSDMFSLVQSEREIRLKNLIIELENQLENAKEQLKELKTS